MRDVRNPESVADHSWGTALLCLYFAEKEKVSLERSETKEAVFVRDMNLIDMCLQADRRRNIPATHEVHRSLHRVRHKKFPLRSA